jgi:hypothetical protein
VRGTRYSRQPSRQSGTIYKSTSGLEVTQGIKNISFDISKVNTPANEMEEDKFFQNYLIGVGKQI